jgi:hypothetical protein
VRERVNVRSERRGERGREVKDWEIEKVGVWKYREQMSVMRNSFVRMLS